MKNRILGLAVVMAAMLSLVGASTASAALQDQLVDDTYEATPGEHVVVDVFTNDTGPSFSWGVMSTGDCGWDGGGVITYDVPLTATNTDVYTCVIAVMDFSTFEMGVESLTITVAAPVDEEPPVVTITSPADGTTFTTNTTTLTYGVTDNMDPSPTCIQKIGGVPFTGAAVTLAEGLNTITVECADAAGKVGADSVDVTYTPPPVGDPVKINLENVTIREQDANVTVYVPVRLSRPSPVDITLSYKTESKKAVGGVDYVEVTDGSLVIEAGEVYGEIEITILGDDYRESSENFFVIGDIAVESGPYATLMKDQATVVIQNDDR